MGDPPLERDAHLIRLDRAFARDGSLEVPDRRLGHVQRDALDIVAGDLDRPQGRVLRRRGIVREIATTAQYTAPTGGGT